MVFNCYIVHLIINVIGLNELSVDLDRLVMQMMRTAMKIMLPLPDPLFVKQFHVIMEMDSTQKEIVTNVSANALVERIMNNVVKMG